MSRLDTETCERILDSFQTLYELLGAKMPANVKGLAGEVMVWHQLAQRGMDFEPKGGQGGYDVLLEGRVKLEVRTTRPNHHADGTRSWGWQLQKTKENRVKYDYVICVALGDSLKIEDAQFFILSADEAMNAKEVDLKRFRGVRRKLWVYDSFDHFRIERAKDARGTLFNDWEEDFNRHKDLHQDWEILRHDVAKS